MKNIFKYMAGALYAGLVLTACSPEEFSGANGNIPQALDYSDNFKVTVDQTTNNAKFEFTSAQGVTPIWIIDGVYSSSFNLTKYYRKKGVYTVECKVKNVNGFSDGSVTKTFEIEKTKMNGFGGFVEDSDYNIMRGVTFANPTFYYAPGWNQIADPVWAFSKGAYNVNLPAATTDRWQAQMMMNTGVAISADKNYDFSVIVTSTVAHGGMKVKICQADDDNAILLDKDFALEAGEPKCLWGSNLEGVDMSNVKVVFDFGGNAANTEISIESFVLKDHADDDKTEVPNVQATPFNYNDAANVWKAVDAEKAFTEEHYYGDANWAAIPCTPTVTHEGSKHTITIPVATPSEEWHAQWKLHTNLSAAADAIVDFSLKVNAKLDGSAVKLPGMTVKLVDSANDGNFFFAKREAIPVEGFVFRFDNSKLAEAKDAQKLSLVFDFGGAPEGAIITIDEITLIKK